ncbi:hypothetical protein Ga0123461_1546 [Mariprofundus aestuarium]|uniref:Uncharacterized protein n=1 Tax=Mariprofundus aestuarium TaxID=1921086 RepID=A0A2K8KY80_MARES|nr:hypothetical protein [Mariprofundus aestuarium]ATX79960.1 hypothetical protein Ga0123461_1546 [Mariprofundus aestuarium]
MIWGIISAATFTSLIWLYDGKMFNLSMAAKIDILFYLMVFGLIWSVFEIMRSDEKVKEIEMRQMYEAGRRDGVEK